MGVYLELVFFGLTLASGVNAVRLAIKKDKRGENASLVAMFVFGLIIVVLSIATS